MMVQPINNTHNESRSRMPRVLVVDDDLKIRKLVRVNLEKRGYTVFEAADGSAAMTLIERELPELILLDLVLPGMDGIEICEWVRERYEIPIIVLSAYKDEGLIVRALDVGADDYVTKPFGYAELLARVRAVMRRSGDHEPQNADGEDRISIGDLSVDVKGRRAFIGKRDLHLTRTEFALLSELATNVDAILSHDELLGRVWGPEYRGSNHYLHVYLGRVRKKMGEEYSQLLETVAGLGYILHSQGVDDPTGGLD